MLTGRRAFDGEDVTETLAAVVRARSGLDGACPRDTPRAVRALLSDCLDTRSEARLRDIGDARLAIDEADGGVPDDAGAPVASRGRQRLVGRFAAGRSWQPRS